MTHIGQNSSTSYKIFHINMWPNMFISKIIKRNEEKTRKEKKRNSITRGLNMNNPELQLQFVSEK